VHGLKREITVDGKAYKVEVDKCPIGLPFSIKVDKKTFEVAFEQEPDYEKSFSIRVNGKPYQVELPSIRRDALLSIKVNNIPFRVELKSATPRIAITAPSPVTVSVQRPTKPREEGVVAAPMAGKIISVRVIKGDSVKVGSVLCVLEAMKMENEITASRGGVVEEVKAQEGKAVNEGDVLIVIK